MPTPISTYFENAQLSLAAYANLSVSMSNDQYRAELLEKGFTDALASQFVATYRIAADTFTDAHTGLSVTLFQRNASSENTMAIRGTDSLIDIAIDGLILTGEADILNPQYISLKNYYLQLVAQGRLGANELMNVTGHSLGGYLAQAFTVDHAVNVAHTYTYNTPGTGGIIVDALQRLGVGDTTIPSSLVTNIVSKNGFSAATEFGTQIGTAVNIYIESETGPLAFLHNHSIETAMDALALYDLFAKIDSNLEHDLPTVSNILEATSTDAGESLERTLDALAKALQGPDAQTTPFGNREAYYSNLIEVRNSLPTGSVSPYRIDSLIGESSSNVFSQAKASTPDGLAHRYALKELNPFVIQGVDYQTLHNQNGSLELYDVGTGQGTWTLVALSDRAELFAEKLTFGQTDGNLARATLMSMNRLGSPTV